MKDNLSLGKAGELRVASELLLRGFDVSLSLVDSGTDLILNNGKKIQVKSSNLRKKEREAYTFTFKSWIKKRGRYIAHNLKDIDFVILWPIPSNDFFIIPTSKIRGKYSIHIVLNIKVKRQNKNRSQYLVFKNNWDLLR